jgi:membrane protein DedA with SNARE-associated domain
VPESKGRKREVYTPQQSMGERKVAKLGSPRWLAPTMVACFLIGLIYIVLFYLAGSNIPVMRDLSALVNVGIGFAFIVVGFILSTKWH